MRPANRVRVPDDNGNPVDKLYDDSGNLLEPDPSDVPDVVKIKRLAESGKLTPDEIGKALDR